MTIVNAISQYYFKDNYQDSVIYTLPKSQNINFCDKKRVLTI